MSTRNAQAILGIGIPVALGLLAVIPWLLWSGDLPNPIATHFALGSGTPDGSMSPLWFGLTSGVLLAASMALVIVVATQSRSMPAASAPGMYRAARAESRVDQGPCRTHRVDGALRIVAVAPHPHSFN